MSTVWGVNVGTHDSSIASVVDGELVFAAHSERSSRKKNDRELHPTTVQQALDVGGEPDKIVFYERDNWKRIRQLWAGQYRTAFSKPDVRMLIPIVDTMPIEEMMHSHIPSRSVAHHHSHAAAGYYTSPYRDAAVLVVDSIGEWETLTIWKGQDRHLKRVFSKDIHIV